MDNELLYEGTQWQDLLVVETKQRRTDTTADEFCLYGAQPTTRKMDKAVDIKDRTLDPILNLPVHSSVTSLCFLSHTKPDVKHAKRSGPAATVQSRRAVNLNEETLDESYGTEESSESDGDDDDDEIVFRSSTISFAKPRAESFRGSLHHNNVLSNRFLASCHSDGEVLLWDLNNQKRVATISPSRGGSGLCVRRMDDPGHMIFQSRDPNGIVSLHAIERCPAGEHSSNTRSNPTVIHQYETYSQTFCQAAPCNGDKNLIALPNSDESAVRVVDWRSNSTVAKYSIAGHGMLTSLALTVAADKTGQGVGKPILACGMESGTAVFFDLTNGSTTTPISEASFALGKDPLLTLDLIPSGSETSASLSSPRNENISNSLLVAAGMAGDAEEVSQLRKDQAGRAVLFKAMYCYEDETGNPTWNFKQRARLSTCRVDRESFNGKPGVSVCRFRPDGRLLAIGGWDRRIRLFERSTGKPMAILKGNAGSVADVDWAPDSMTSGLLASASREEKLISIWQCYAKS